MSTVWIIVVTYLSLCVVFDILFGMYVLQERLPEWLRRWLKNDKTK